MSARDDSRPLIAHVVFRFDVGGLENGVVNLINHLPERQWRHAVIALDDVALTFRARVTRADVAYYSLRKRRGHLFWIYPRLIKLFRTIRPDVVHTRNLAALEATVPAWAAGVRARVHGEHGWDVHDIDGTSRRFKWVRRVYSPFVQKYVALSDQISRYLVREVGISSRRIVHIYNGVDIARFRASSNPVPARMLLPFDGDDLFVVGSVGRMQPVKDHLSLVRAFIRTVDLSEDLRCRLRLVIVGDGPLRSDAELELKNAGCLHLAWLPGARDDVAELMRSFDLFVQPSLSEGVSNTILEAMATGLPVIATRVGGNAELVDDGVTGTVVMPAKVDELKAAILRYFHDAQLGRQHGTAGRRRAEEHFSIASMVGAYAGLYESVVPPNGRAHPATLLQRKH